jgi:hypothetical protein
MVKSCLADIQYVLCLHDITTYLPIPVVARFKVCVCDRSLAGTAGSNPAGGMAVCLLSVVCCSAMGRSLVQRSPTVCVCN